MLTRAERKKRSTLLLLAPSAAQCGFRLRAKDGTIDGHTIAGATAELETEDDHRRVTATRLVAVGVLALAAQKRVGDVRVTITGPGNSWQISGSTTIKHLTEIRNFCTVFNRYAQECA